MTGLRPSSTNRGQALPRTSTSDDEALPDRIANHTGLPDRIFIFRNPLLDMCEDLEDLAEEIRITVVHEVAHHFGIDDSRLHDLGYA